MTRSIVLLSGGLDSAVCLHEEVEAGRDAHALTVDYGQSNREEISRAVDLCAAHGGKVHHQVVEVPVARLMSTYKADWPELLGGGAGPHVPARNAIFLSLAWCWAEMIDATRVVVGFNANDAVDFHDCSLEFAGKMQAALLEGTPPSKTPIFVSAPLLSLTKLEVLKLAQRRGVDVEATLSCYRPAGGRPCGSCRACHYRQDAWGKTHGE